MRIDSTFFRAGYTYRNPVPSAQERHFAALLDARGFQLPASYSRLLMIQNGGPVRRSLFRLIEGDDFAYLNSLAGIGCDRYSFCFDLLEPLEWQESARDVSPSRLLVFDADWDSREFLALDYAVSSIISEPAVVLVTTSPLPPCVEPLAPTFEAFLAGLQLADPDSVVGLPAVGVGVENLVEKLCHALRASVHRGGDADWSIYHFRSSGLPESGVTLRPNVDFAMHREGDRVLKRRAGLCFPEAPECDWILRCPLDDEQMVQLVEALDDAGITWVPIHRPVDTGDDWEFVRC